MKANRHHKMNKDAAPKAAELSDEEILDLLALQSRSDEPS